MSEEPMDIATKLLMSSDAKVAAAAKRIFAGAVTEYDQKAEPVSSNKIDLTNSTITNSDIPADVQEAASAVVMLAPLHRRVLSTSGIESTEKTSKQGLISFHTPELLSSNIVSPPPSEISSVTDSNKSTMSPKSGKKATSQSERLQRSRERNKMHARKTRQRKKEHMQILEARVEELKKGQISLKLQINEKNTANILLGMFAVHCQEENGVQFDAKVEELMNRATEDIPDASKIPELPALILPGQHNKRRGQSAPGKEQLATAQYPNDGIDYELLGKDRSSCTPAELDKIRRERNRMHAKRTRDRKRIFMEKMEEMILQLETENGLLQQQLERISEGKFVSEPTPRKVSTEEETTTVETGEASVAASDADTPNSSLSSTENVIPESDIPTSSGVENNSISDQNSLSETKMDFTEEVNDLPIVSSDETSTSAIKRCIETTDTSSLHLPQKRQRFNDGEPYGKSSVPSLTESNQNTAMVLIS